MKNIEIILTIATMAIGLLITTITFLQKFIKSEKAKKIAEHITEVSKAVLAFVSEAETFIELNGAEKKNFVLEKVNEFAIENHMSFDVEAVCELIEDYIKMSKAVNTKKT